MNSAPGESVCTKYRFFNSVGRSSGQCSVASSDSASTMSHLIDVPSIFWRPLFLISITICSDSGISAGGARRPPSCVGTSDACVIALFRCATTILCVSLPFHCTLRPLSCRVSSASVMPLMIDSTRGNILFGPVFQSFECCGMFDRPENALNTRRAS